MSAHRRSLATAAAAGAVLIALFFVPTAKATPEASGPRHGAATAGAHTPESKAARSAGHATVQPPARLADTGSFDSAPYMVGGLGFLGAGGLLATRSLRSA